MTPVSRGSGVRPSGRTVSGRGFDRPLGVLVLELYAAQVSERGVEPSLIVDLVDEAGKVGRDVPESFASHRVYRLHLQRLHEALGFGVVVRISAPAHRTNEAVIGQELPVELGRALGSAVGMMHATSSWPPHSDGGFERRCREPGVDRAADGVPHHATRPGVEDNGQIDEASADGDIGYVRYPELVRTVDEQIARAIREDRAIVIAAVVAT